MKSTIVCLPILITRTFDILSRMCLHLRETFGYLFFAFLFLSSIIPVKPMLGRCGGGNGVTQSVDPGTNQQNTVRFSKWDILNYTITLISWLFCLIFYISLFDCSIQSASPHPATATKSITQQQSPTSVPHLEAVDPVSTDGAQSWRLLRI